MDEGQIRSIALALAVCVWLKTGGNLWNTAQMYYNYIDTGDIPT